MIQSIKKRIQLKTIFFVLRKTDQDRIHLKISYYDMFFVSQFAGLVVFTDANMTRIPRKFLKRMFGV